MPKVLFIGDINVDVMMGGMESLPVVDREVICKSYDIVMGASTVICTCAYASLGGNTSIIGLAGEDEYGEFMIKGLNSFGVDTSLVRRTDRVKTGVTVNLIYANTRTQVTYPGTIAEFDGSELDGSIFAGFDHVHFGGVYIQKKLLPEITRLLKTARKAGLSTSIDSQWDSSETWTGMDEWLPHLSYLFVNKDEALSISKTASAEQALAWLAAKTEFPVVKTGDEGALVLSHGAAKPVPTIKVQPVDTTGAGDSFDAGFLFATIEKKMAPIAACDFANATAARSCTFVGGVNARSTYEDILRFKSERQSAPDLR
jgi:sugar/nucleoside kinase (ribokinase family)